jgi:hypothetical protein
MKKYNILILILFGSINDLSAQSFFDELNKNKIQPNTVVASIDTISVTAEEFFYNYEYGPAFAKREKKSKDIFLNNMINEKLLALEAYAHGMFNDANTKNIYYDIEADIASEELFKNEIYDKVQIKDSEINKIAADKKCELDIQWLYSKDENKVDGYLKSLSNRISFDSLFNSQINDSVFADQRSMRISLFNLIKKNNELAKIIDTMTVGNASAKIITDDGFYIFKVVNKTTDLIKTESESNKLKKEAKEYLLKSKSDSLSEVYVNELIIKSKPIIKRDAFNILRSYLGKYILNKDLYAEWELDKKLESSLSNLGLTKNDKYPGINLIETNNGNIKLEDFIYWYNNREQYLKFNKSSRDEFSKSLENYVWQMLRDNLLSKQAREKKYFDNDWVKKQSKWWKDKIAYAALRDQYSKSIVLENNEVSIENTNLTKKEKINDQLSKKILYKVLELKKKYNITINKQVLEKINISSENNIKAIDFYTVKKDGLIPRPAFPSIDPDWANWQ